jgi:probable F420-dependent oxidoreductase
MTIRIFTRLNAPLKHVADEAREIESLGFDGVLADEIAHDPFYPLLIVAEHTKKLQVMTGIAVGFARSPMTLAVLAHDLNALSGGRFSLGLGSQIAPHITRRFSMPWSSPASRMREMVQAIRAIFANWYSDAPLCFEGEFYTHTLMPPLFRPEDIEHGAARIGVAAVGPLMTETAASVADFLLVHSFTTEDYIRQHTLPHVHAGLAKTGREASALRLFYPPFIVTGATEEKFAECRAAAKERIAFYASTPAYRPILERHGWGELQTELHALTRANRWAEMPSLISDEVLATFAAVGEAKDIAPVLWRRYGDVIQDFSLICPFISLETLAGIGADLRLLSEQDAASRQPTP